MAVCFLLTSAVRKNYRLRKQMEKKQVYNNYIPPSFLGKSHKEKKGITIDIFPKGAVYLPRLLIINNIKWLTNK